MPRKLIQDIKKIQYLNILTFGLLTLILAGFLLWHQTIEGQKQRLLTLSGIVSQIICDNEGLIPIGSGDMEKLRIRIELRLQKMLRYYPADITSGFYSRRLDQIILLAPRNRFQPFKHYMMSLNNPGRETWRSLKPRFSIYWSAIHANWILQCDYPAIIHGQAIGHTFAEVTLTSFLWAYLQFALLLYFAMVAVGHLAPTCSRLLTRRIMDNVNQLTHAVHEINPEYEYTEFCEIAAQLQKTNQQITDILESMDDPFFILDKEWRFIYLNQKAEQELGFSLNHLIGKRITEIFPETKYNEYYQKAGSIPMPVHFEIFSEKARRLDLHIYPTAGGYAIYYRDITERKTTEQELKKYRDRVENIMDSITDAFFTLDKEGRFTYVNQETLRLLNRPADNLTGKLIWRVFPNTLTGIYLSQYQKVVTQHVPVFFEVFALILNRWVEVHVYPAPDGGISVYFHDITERKQAEELRSRLATIVELSQDAIISIDLRGIITSWNLGAERMCGYSAAEIIGKSIFILVPPEKIDEVIQLIDRLKRDEVIKPFETVRVTKDGTKLDVLLTPSILKDLNGQVIGGSSILRDITERKQYEKKIYELAAIVESSEDAIVGATLECIIINWNRGAEKMFGYTAGEAIGKPISFLTPHELMYECDNIKDQINRGAEIESFETVRVGKNGKLVEVSIRVSLIRHHNTIIGSATILRDITARKAAETELMEEHERLLVTLNSIGDGVMAADEQGRIVMMNRVAERLTGWNQPEASGMRLEQVCCLVNDKTGEPDENIMNAVLDSGKLLHLNHISLISRERMEIPVSISCSPIKPVNGPEIFGLVLVIQDRTEKQRVEMELLKTEKLESLEILAGGIAHDFNNILAAILANLQLAMIKLKKGEDIVKYMQDTVETTRKASDLTKQLLTFSKGGAPVKKSAAIIDLIKDTTDFALRGSKTKAELYLSGELWAVEVDTGQISQVINNLVINAKQAMPKGGAIKIYAENLHWVEEGRFQPGHYVKITIQDQGAGIPAEIMDKIFDPFFTTKKKGTGLGLSTSYSIIKQHNGYIEVESEPGAGARFIIYLPASPREQIPEPTRSLVAATGEGKLLLMDDEDTIRNVVGEMLSYCGYRVELARDGEEMIVLYRKAREADHDPFDAVIMDLTIPGSIGGQEAIVMLRNYDPQITAIVSSGYTNDPIMADYERYGFSGVVTKPYKLDELQEVLHKALCQKNR